MTSLSRRLRSFHVAVLALGVLSSAGVYAQNPATPPLPSGLSPVSQLMVEGFGLALDSDGTLFRLDDHGKHWKPVHQQWEGKAVELLGIPPLTAVPGSGQEPRTDADQEPFAAVLLRSTAALHWVSVDRGKTWKPSTLDDVRRNDVRWSGQ